MEVKLFTVDVWVDMNLYDYARRVARALNDCLKTWGVHASRVVSVQPLELHARSGLHCSYLVYFKPGGRRRATGCAVPVVDLDDAGGLA